MAGQEWQGKLGDRFQVGDDLYVEFVEIAALKEQDVNAQVVQPRHMERLTENIRIRGALEGLPYCYRDPDAAGPAEIVSGHHRTRAARQAGLTVIPVLMDERKMTRSTVVAKQIAHNEIHGAPDEQILRQLIGMMNTVDDLLMSGLPEDLVPTYADDDTNLALPHVEFEWKLVTLLFLPKRLEAFADAVLMIDNATKLLGVADEEQFGAFARAVHQHGRVFNVKNLAATIAAVTETAAREVAELLADGVQNTSWSRTGPIVGTQMPTEAAEVVAQALAAAGFDAGLSDEDPHRKWRALELVCADFLAGRAGEAPRAAAQTVADGEDSREGEHDEAVERS